MMTLWKEELSGVPFPEFGTARIPRILTFPTSLEFIADTGCSVSRFGDGEFYVACGKPGPSFQKTDPGLSDSLNRIIRSEPRPECAIGIARPHFYDTRFTHQFIRTFVSRDWSVFVKEHGVLDLLRNYVYLDACLSIPRHHYEMPKEYWTAWFAEVKRFFSKRNVLLVSGDRTSAGFYREAAHDVRIMTCPSTDAWSAADKIKADILRINANRKYTVVLACGPAATVLAWELAEDMQCLDLGHLGKEYYAFLNNEKPSENLSQFYGS